MNNGDIRNCDRQTMKVERNSGDEDEGKFLLSKTNLNSCWNVQL